MQLQLEQRWLPPTVLLTQEHTELQLAASTCGVDLHVWSLVVQAEEKELKLEKILVAAPKKELKSTVTERVPNLTSKVKVLSLIHI